MELSRVGLVGFGGLILGQAQGLVEFYVQGLAEFHDQGPQELV